LPDGGRVEQILPNVDERKRRLKEQVHIRDVDGQIASECPRVHRPLVQMAGQRSGLMLSSTFVLMGARQPAPVAQARRSRSMMVMDCRLLALANPLARSCGCALPD
jgi:hypothetical protein